MKYLSLFIIYIFILNVAKAQISTIVYTNDNKIQTIGNKVQILEDKNNSLTINQVLNSDHFKYSKQQVPNFQIGSSAYWIKFDIQNLSQSSNLAIELSYPTIDSITFISLLSNNKYLVEKTGEYVPFYNRKHKHQNYIFDIYIPKNQTKEYLIKIIASEQMQLPLKLGEKINIIESLFIKDLIFGIYSGIIIVMLFYNLFVYFSVKDNTYLYYVFYILFVGLTQACIQGYAARFFYPNSIHLANLMLVITAALSGIFALLFAQKFILIKSYTPYLNNIIQILLIVYCIILILGLIGNYLLSTKLLQLTAGIGSLLVMIASYKISKLGYKPAFFFLIGWSIFLSSVIVFVLKNIGILPYNNLTFYALQIGSSLEVILLSFALADKINIYKKEKEESQEQALLALEENAILISNQNITLERNVKERTHELTIANHDLNRTLTELKEAQTQLVEAEKMASLGQLTAGIAHEINNPINFVTANVSPLRRDVDLLIDAITNIENVGLSDVSTTEKQQQIEDYKEDIEFDYLKIEINHLIKGIHEGASRTAEIVKGLKIFSRLDEDVLKKADINEGLESTLIIANNLIGNKIQVIKNLGDVPQIECFPGKLNQVFLNIISNAVFAINERFDNQQGGILKITTENDNKYLYIKIEDNGTGMSEAVKNKIFEPFFTTKNVGVGTGLGMSIVYNTIKKHNADIILNTTEGIGTEFILKLNLIFEESVMQYQSE